MNTYNIIIAILRFVVRKLDGLAEKDAWKIVKANDRIKEIKADKAELALELSNVNVMSNKIREIV